VNGDRHTETTDARLTRRGGDNRTLEDFVIARYNQYRVFVRVTRLLPTQSSRRLGRRRRRLLLHRAGIVILLLIYLSIRT